MRMTPSEKVLRESFFTASCYRAASRLITKMRREIEAAERERCAKVAEGHAKRFAEFAARAKTKGHNVDDIVARRIASEDIAAAIREGK